MIGPGMRKAVFLLHQKGMPVREIARRLQLSRGTVRAIIKEHGVLPKRIRKDKQRIDLELLRRLYAKCEGRIQRVHEMLNEEEDISVTYPTLTRMLREAQISRPPHRACDSRPDRPGVEMQHDTSPYRLKLGAHAVQVIASLLYLRYSKRRYLRFYISFNRFKMKCFFHEALMCWGYSARRCIIDNTNLARLRGTGKNAVIVPEMVVFSKRYAFAFECHEKGHSDRKAGEERSFRTVEENFFPGRTFEHLEDLNQQAFAWATVRMEHRSQGKAKLIPAKAFEHEQGFLQKLPADTPEPYQVHERLTDEYGYVSFDGNFYWVQRTRRLGVKVLEYAETIHIYLKREQLAVYPLPPHGIKNKRFSPEGGPPPPYRPRNRKKPALEEQKQLRGMGEAVGAYLDFLLAAKGVQHHRFIRALHALTRQMSAGLFVRAVERALRYWILDVETIERIAMLYATEGAPLPAVDVDTHLQEREQYREGCLTDPPDLSVYDWLFEQDDEDAPEENNGNG